MNGIECAFVARLGADPERRMVKNGSLALCSFSAVVDEGEDRDRAGQWLRVSTFGDKADEIAPTLKKGDRCYVEGRLKLDTWTKDGAQKFGLSVTAWTVQPMGKIGRQRPRKPGNGAHRPVTKAAEAPVAGLNDPLPW